MDYTIFYPTALHEIDPKDDNIDVCVTLGDGRCFTVVVATPENLKHLMEQDGTAYLHPDPPFLIVQELTDENIRRVIGELLPGDDAQDDTLLRIYGSDLA